MIESYQKLAVWQKSIDFVTYIYNITQIFPKEEAYGLTAQMRRAAISIPSNIAEGRSKRSTRDYLRFLSISYGSLAELETQLIIAEKLRYITPEIQEQMLMKTAEIGRMLNGLIKGLEKKLNSES